MLEEPEEIIQQQEDLEDFYDEPAEDNQQPATNNDVPDDLFNDGPTQQQNGLIEFDDDFWR